VFLDYWVGFHTVPAYYCFRKGKIGMVALACGGVT
jgi:hypothetical protein